MVKQLLPFIFIISICGLSIQAAQATLEKKQEQLPPIGAFDHRQIEQLVKTLIPKKNGATFINKEDIIPTEDKTIRYYTPYEYAILTNNTYFMTQWFKWHPLRASLFSSPSSHQSFAHDPAFNHGCIRCKLPFFVAMPITEETLRLSLAHGALRADRQNSIFLYLREKAAQLTSEL